MTDANGIVPRSDAEGGERGAALATLRRGWALPPDVLATLPRMALDIVQSSADDRVRIRAAEVLRAMHRDNLDAAIAADKLERLDAGEATEALRFPQLTFGPMRSSSVAGK